MHGYYYQCQLQVYVTKRSFCDFVVWTNAEVHIERITLDEDFIKSALPTAEKFFKLCILPELLGKWYTRKQLALGQPLPTEEDDRSWCYCREDKGGDMIA